ncbi:MAG: class I SAM-dependent methyltransferase [Actinomycetota bacterium]|nr:class I SAM-dependent methyltransferase [Actinomycetota bacterium]
MRGYDATTYGETMGDLDGLDWANAHDEEAASEFLAGIAKGGTALELGVGTGRVALPLSELGVAVTGVDASPNMSARLADKCHDTSLRFVLGDFADVPVDGPFDLIYCVYNTFLLLASQESQLRCFRNVAGRLAPGGSFVVQTSVPRFDQLAQRQSTKVLRVELDRVVLMVATHDPMNQLVERQRIVIENDDGTKLYPMVYRYVWPSELDLMAALSGLTLAGRWNGWRYEPYSAVGGYVVVFRRPEETP